MSANNEEVAGAAVPALTAAQGPRIDLEISFDRSRHSYTEHDVAPTMTLIATSRADYPITIFTYRSPLDIKGALTNNGFIITDLATGEPVKTTGGIRINRPNFSRLRGSADEGYYLTLLPNKPMEISGAFGFGASVKQNRRPLPYSLIKCGWVRDENGKEMKIRRSTQATGVDGLEPGHRYSIGVDVEQLKKCLWAPATKEEILVDAREEGQYLTDYERLVRNRPLDAQYEEGFLDIEE